MKYYRFILSLILIFLAAGSLSANENIHTYRDEYYDALSLNGATERPSLFFHSYSSNDWSDVKGEHPWENSSPEQNPLWEKENARLYLEPLGWFSSYNMESPNGMNDGGLWQGKGYNSALSGGLSFQSDHWLIALYPELYFSQNLDFITQTASSWSGYEYGYPYSGLDAPQRFGEDAFWSWSWGQTQIRYNLDDWTIGFGTENIWIGSGSEAALLLSNNADGFPHIDLGLNRHSTPWGDVEFRLWWGWLKSSEYIETVDSDSYLDYLGGVSMAWEPVFIPGFSVGFHKTTQVTLDEFEIYHIIAPIDPGLIKDFQGGVAMGQDGSDGRASITWSWMSPLSGFEFYGEWIMEDYTPSVFHLIKRPDHASGFLLGARQHIPYKNYKDRFFLLNAEFSSLVWSRDYYLNGLGWGGGFYRHNLTSVGYSNEGQIMGAGYGSGGNMQHLELDYYAPFGMAGTYLTRIKADDVALFYTDNLENNDPDLDVPVQLTIGMKSYLLLGQGFSAGIDMAYVYDMNFATVNNLEQWGMYTSVTLQYRY